MKCYLILAALLSASISAMAQAETKVVAMIPIPLEANAMVYLRSESCTYNGGVAIKKDGSFEMVLKNKTCGQSMKVINLKIDLTDPLAKGDEVTIAE